MNSEGLGEMFDGDSAEACGGKRLLMSVGLACADMGVRTPIGMSGNLNHFIWIESMHSVIRISIYDKDNLILCVCTIL